ncbi:hypothetical protein ACU8V3_10795 [Cobetia marina]
MFNPKAIASRSSLLASDLLWSKVSSKKVLDQRESFAINEELSFAATMEARFELVQLDGHHPNHYFYRIRS